MYWAFLGGVVIGVVLTILYQVECLYGGEEDE